LFTEKQQLSVFAFLVAFTPIMSSDQELEQAMSRVRSPADLEDFMNYYEFDESEKQTARTEWAQNQNQDRGFDNQNQTQDRGIGKLLVGGFALKKIFGRKHHGGGGCYGKRSPWQPGMGSRNMPGCSGMNGNDASCGMGGCQQQQPQMQQQNRQQQQQFGQPQQQQQFYQPYRQA
jgi:hypothetical protein